MSKASIYTRTHTEVIKCAWIVFGCDTGLADLRGMDVLSLSPYDCLLNFILDLCLLSSVRDMPVAGGSTGLEEEWLCGSTLQSGGRDREEAI